MNGNVSMPAKSVTVSDDVYFRIYQNSQEENKNTAKIMGELIETALYYNVYSRLSQLKKEKNGFFIEILKDVIKKGLQK